MKQLPSAQFRLAYARLTEPTVVTVLGRPIGAWTPVAHVRAGLGHPGDGDGALTRVSELEDEVRQLKRELAKRQPPDFVSGPVTVTSPERLLPGATFAPGIEDRAFERGQQSVAMKTGRDRQKLIDATLAKVNKGKKA